INDFSIGLHETFGSFAPVSSADDWFHAELTLIWHMNPIYTRIPLYHFIAEGRYNGAEVVNISPDVNPSHTHSDYQIAINGATDAAFALSLAQVIFEEGLADLDFVREQTDLGMLVREDTGRYLRETDVKGEGSDDQLYQWDPAGLLRPADRGNILLNGLAIALEGTFEAALHDGSTVAVRPAAVLLREKLDAEYRPEQQQAITGVHPETVRTLARKIASKRTNILLGINACKFFHGDLIERAMSLVLAVSGNWGRQGTGIRCWASGMHDGQALAGAKAGSGAAHTEAAIVARDAGITAMKEADPTMTTELAVREGARARFEAAGAPVPAFWWYWHAGFRERWNRREWGDESLPRSFDEYVDEALARGWWEGPGRVQPDDTPRVLIECGGNMIRRTRGGKTALLDTLWPQLDLIVSMDFRMSQTALYADFVLPVTQQYEKIGTAIATPHILNVTLSDGAADPPEEVRDEYEIFQQLLEAIADRAGERGLEEFVVGGKPRAYADLPGLYRPHEHMQSRERLVDEQLRDSALAGTLPTDASIDRLRELGHMRFIDWGVSPMALSQASPLKANETHAPWRDHVEQGTPFPTFSRRAQFYIDHEWFLEAGEALPVHKPNPRMGGDYPLGMTSGHSRWSIHSMNHGNRLILGTHRGEPHVMVSPSDASARGVADDQRIRVFNDVGEFTARAKIGASVKPGQIISYNGWAGFQYDSWSGANEIEPGMVKWIGFAGGYGQLRYTPMEWQPVPVDRWIACDFEAAQGR
ncbi:MAG: molybdopterin-dependent oxidoreductase, partial [Dehalococcoidia bacterium]